MKNIGILGSTGSIGRQALDIVRSNPDKYNIKYLVAKNNVELLIQQTKEFNPDYVCIANQDKYKVLKNNIVLDNILSGHIGTLEICSLKDIDIALNAITGFDGLEPTIAIIKSGTNIALANKESIVSAGEIIMKLVDEYNVTLFPVDSEHSALWQCLKGESLKNVKNLILTASGGPFRNLDIKHFSKIKKNDALKHPNWDMGAKISIDSATMMNKGFELIEAYWLFKINFNNIKIIIHPQSIVHSMVEFIDGSLKAQLSKPDMRQPIQYAFTYPDRVYLENMSFDFMKHSTLEFEKPDLDKFKCIKLAYDALKLGGNSFAVLNVSNDLAVRLFLKEKISFNMISKIIENSLKANKLILNPTLDEIYETINWTKNYVKSKYII